MSFRVFGVLLMVPECAGVLLLLPPEGRSSTTAVTPVGGGGYFCWCPCVWRGCSCCYPCAMYMGGVGAIAVAPEGVVPLMLPLRVAVVTLLLSLRVAVVPLLLPLRVVVGGCSC